MVTRRYQPASLLRFHQDDRWPVLELGSPGGRRSQYDLWRRPGLCPGESIVLVAPDRDLPTEVLGHWLAEPVARVAGGQQWWITPIHVDFAEQRCELTKTEGR
jgi:hypothetical protein